MQIPTIKIFHLDDDLFELKRIKDRLGAETALCRFEVSTFQTAKDLLDASRHSAAPDLVLLDVHLGQDVSETGVSVAQKLKVLYSGAATVIHTSDFAMIRKSITAGVDDFILKSEDPTDLGLRLFTIYRAKQAQIEMSVAVPKSAKTAKSKAIGTTMEDIGKRLSKIQNSAIRSVHVFGESGTGKEVVVDLLESTLPAKTPLLRVNCAAITPTLLESELFGHVRGAFTGALNDKAGFFEAASGGWIFLDEVGCLPPSAQAALLRAIEQQEILRVGDARTRRIDVKVISATNVMLDELVQQGTFRNDLLQRLREAQIHMPPLRERREELKSLIDHFCRTEEGGPYKITSEARKVLEDLSWSNGNVRELRNCIRAMTEHQADKLLTAKALPEWAWKQHEPTTSDSPGSTAKTGKNIISFKYPGHTVPNFETLTDLLLAEVIRILGTESGIHSLRRIAEAIGMARTTLSYRLKRMVDNGTISQSDFDKLSEKKKRA